jgi:2-aminoadipate transaminase
MLNSGTEGIPGPSDVVLADARRSYLPGEAISSQVIDLALGYPDLTTMPWELLKTDFLENDGLRKDALSYGPRGGQPGLIDVLRETVIANESREGAAVITNGSMEAINLCFESLSRLGQGLLLSQDPTFPGAIIAAEAAGLKILGVPADDDGIEPDLLAALLKNLLAAGHQVAGLYVMPRWANPDGSCLSLERRVSLVHVAERAGLTIIEDDAYRAATYVSCELPSLHNLSPSNVVHIVSLSKVLCPGIRLAVVLGPTQIVKRMVALSSVGGVAPLTSALVMRLLCKVDFPKHMRDLKIHYQTRRDIAIAAMRSSLPHVPFREPRGGFFLWLELPQGIDLPALQSRCWEAGVRFMPDSAFLLEPRPSRHIRLAFSYEQPDRLVVGITRLADALSETLSRN